MYYSFFHSLNELSSHIPSSVKSYFFILGKVDEWGKDCKEKLAPQSHVLK